MNPGDHCMWVRDDNGNIVAVEHVEPCRDNHPTGTVTDVRTGEIVDNRLPEFRVPQD